MKIFATCKETDFQYDSLYKNEKHSLFLAETEQDFDIESLGNGRYSLIKDNQSYLLHLISKDGIYHVHLNGAHFEVEVEDERMRRVKELVQSNVSGPAELLVKAPIPGVIVQLNVEEGNTITKGQPLLILEAMKMENVIKASCDCKIEQILVSEKEAVQQNQGLIKLVMD